MVQYWKKIKILWNRYYVSKWQKKHKRGQYPNSRDDDTQGVLRVSWLRGRWHTSLSVVISPKTQTYYLESVYINNLAFASHLKVGHIKSVFITTSKRLCLRYRSLWLPIISVESYHNKYAILFIIIVKLSLSFKSLLHESFTFVIWTLLISCEILIANSPIRSSALIFFNESLCLSSKSTNRYVNDRYGTGTRLSLNNSKNNRYGISYGNL